MQVPPPPLLGEDNAESLQRFVARTLENCDAVALKLDDLVHRVGKRAGGPKRNFTMLRTQTALQQTESVLAQTAHSLRRTAGVIAPVAP